MIESYSNYRIYIYIWSVWDYQFGMYNQHVIDIYPKIYILKSRKKTMSVRAKDNIIFLVNNKLSLCESFTFYSYFVGKLHSINFG